MLLRPAATFALLLAVAPSVMAQGPSPSPSPPERDATRFRRRPASGRYVDPESRFSLQGDVRTLMLTAALEWRLVEPAALQADLRVAQEISAQLRDLSEAVEAGDVGGSSRAVSQSEKALLGLFTLR